VHTSLKTRCDHNKSSARRLVR